MPPKELLPLSTDDIPEGHRYSNKPVRRPSPWRPLLQKVSCVAILLVWTVVWGPSTYRTLSQWKVTSSLDGGHTPPRKPPTRSVPSRELIWGDINFIHTTDSHGWLLGHQKKVEGEINGSGTFGDFFSFVTHMKAIAEEKGKDLLVIDTGDLHHGSGLSDAYPKPEFNGQRTNDIFAELPYDVLTVGNNELKEEAITTDLHNNFARRWNGKYLATNVEINITDSSGESILKPLSQRSLDIVTARGRKGKAFGIIFNLQQNTPNSKVTSPADLVEQPWFQNEIADKQDFFLVAGHIPLDGKEAADWTIIQDAIRKIHKDVPIFMFGGHTHWRNCSMPDDRSMALQSGRYMETIGWMSSTLNKEGALTRTHRYLDANRNTYQFHTGKTRENFDTTKGKKITTDLNNLVKEWELDTILGYAPQDYYLYRVPMDASNSVVSLYINEVLPTALPKSNPSRANIPYVVVANAGVARYDIFKGPFTRNDQYSVSPFPSGFKYIQARWAVAKAVAQKLIELKKKAVAGGDKKTGLVPRTSQALPGHGRLTLGQMNDDSERCPGDDPNDTPHIGTPYIEQTLPYISYNNAPQDITDDTVVDLIFVDYFERDILKVAKGLDVEFPSHHNQQQVRPPNTPTVSWEPLRYGTLTTSTAYEIFAKAKWKRGKNRKGWGREPGYLST